MANTLHGAIDYAQLKQRWQSEWEEGKIYNINDIVSVGGTAFVCVTTTLFDGRLYGPDYKPGTDLVNWQKIAPGTQFKGDWSWKTQYFVGDVVRWNSDYYQCIKDTFGGHPKYENGGLSTTFALIGKSPRRNRTRNILWFMNMPPMGWTRNNGEHNQMYAPQSYIACHAINGDFEYTWVGREYGSNRHGSGERGADWTGYNGTAVGVQYGAKKGAFDFWDYQDGAQPTITGEDPKIIQIVGNYYIQFVLFDNGEVYGSGYNGNGELADGTSTTRNFFVRTGRNYLGGRGSGTLRGKRIVKIGTNQKSGNATNDSAHSCFAISDAGEVFTWGWNNYGQLGTGNTSNYSSVYQIPRGYFHNKKVVDMWMSGGNYAFAYAMTEDGDLYSWGYGSDGATGNQSFYNQYRPEKVKYTWSQFGGIKKIIPWGYNAEAVCIVLTNDGTLHGTGNLGDGSNPIFGAGTTMDTYVPTFTPLAQLFEAKSNSLGLGNKLNAIANLINITRSCDDFWVHGNGQVHNIIAKQKGTGLMFTWGHYLYNALPVFDRSVNQAEYAGDNPYAQPNMAFPTLLYMGNMTDIKHVQTVAEGANCSLCWWNSDGRLWVSVGNGGYAMRGIGSLVANPSSALRRTQKLPWETFFTDYSPTQMRFAERYNVLASCTDGSNGGFMGVSTNNRFVMVNSNMGWNYSWDPSGGESTYAFNNSSPTRQDI